MQRFLNVLRMHRVHNAIMAETFTVPYADFVRYEKDTDTMTCVDPNGVRWITVDFRDDVVYLRKAGAL